MRLESYYKLTEYGWKRVRFVDFKVGDLIKKYHSDDVYRVYKPVFLQKYCGLDYRRTVGAKRYLQ